MKKKPNPGVWKHSKRKGIAAGTAGLSISWAISEGRALKFYLSALGLAGCPLFTQIQERVISGQIFLLLLVEFNFKIKLFKMCLLKLVDSVSTNYRGSDCVMLELCNSLILPSLILFILVLHSILGIKILVSFYFFSFSIQQKWKFIDMNKFLIEN